MCARVCARVYSHASVHVAARGHLAADASVLLQCRLQRSSGFADTCAHPATLSPLASISLICSLRHLTVNTGTDIRDSSRIVNVLKPHKEGRCYVMCVAEWLCGSEVSRT